MFAKKQVFYELKTIKDLVPGLQARNLDAQFVPTQPSDPVEKVVIDLSSDAMPSLLLILSLASTAYAAMRAQNEPGIDPANKAGFGEFDYLQFYVPLSIDIDSDYLNDVSQLLLGINSQLPLIGFGFTQTEKASAGFRHMMLLESQQINLNIVVRSIELIEFLVNEFAPVIEAVATGKQQLNELE